MKKIGRPSKYCPKLARLICHRIATNTHGLKKLCSDYGDMPSHETINQWRWQHPDFSDQYLAAKSLQVAIIVEECEALLDEVLYYVDSNENQRIDPASVKLAKAKVNMRKWHASKLAPKIYGHKKVQDYNQKYDASLLQELLALRSKLKDKTDC